MTGIAPKISITENNISETEMISLKFNCIHELGKVPNLSIEINLIVESKSQFQSLQWQGNWQF